MYQFINEFTISVLGSSIFSIIDELGSKDMDHKTSSTTKKKKTKTKKSTKKIKPRSYSEEMPSTLFADWPEGEADDEDEYDDEDEDDDEDEIIPHLRNFVSIMDGIDDALEKAAEEDPECGDEVYQKFGNYYNTIVPYIELINVTYQQHFIDELSSSGEKLSKLVGQFIDEFINEIDDESVSLASKLNDELDVILHLTKIRVDDGFGRPTFNSVFHNTNDDETSDETQTE